MVRTIVLALLLLLPVQAAAQTLEGSWALRIDGAIIFRFDLARDGEGWKGSWARPGSFASDGERFANLSGPTETIKAVEGREIGAWAELTFPDDRPSAVPDVFRFNLLGPDRVELIYTGTGLAPYVLERVAADALLGPWEQGKIYRRAGASRVTPPPASRGGEAQGPVIEGR